MDRDVLRLELVKLLHRADRSPTDNIAAAQLYERYIGEDAMPAKRGPGRPRKADKPVHGPA